MAAVQELGRSGFPNLDTQFPEQIVLISIARQPACFEISKSSARGSGRRITQA